MRRKTNGQSIINLNTSEEIEKFKNDNKVVLIYFGNNKKDIEEYIKVSRKDDEYPFGIVESEILYLSFLDV